jgi:hypothetical protein
MRGVISKCFDWLWHPQNDDSTVTQWVAGLVLILIAAFLWSTVVAKTIAD